MRTTKTAHGARRDAKGGRDPGLGADVFMRRTRVTCTCWGSVPRPTAIKFCFDLNHLWALGDRKPGGWMLGMVPNKVAPRSSK